MPLEKSQVNFRWKPEGRCARGVEGQVTESYGRVKVGILWEEIFGRLDRVTFKVADRKTRVVGVLGMVCVTMLPV